MGPPTLPTTTASAWQEARRLAQAQTDYCARRGIGCKRSGGSSTGGSGSVGGWAYFPYRLSVPYAGASLECVVTLPVPLASAQAAPAGAEEEAGLWDDDVGEGDDTEPASSMGPLPDILPLGLKTTDADALTGPTTVEAPYAALFPSWAELYPFLAGVGGGGTPPQPWDARRPGALLELVEEVRRLVARRQAAGAATFPDETTRFELGMAADIEGAEILTRTTLAGHEATVLLPLLPTPAAEDEEEEGAGAAGGGSQQGLVEVVDEEEEDPSAYPPEWREVKLQVVLRVDGAGFGREAEPRVLVPASLPLAKKAVEKRRLPSLGADTMLLDFREQVRSQILTPWAKRRELVRVLSANYVLLECDTVEYSQVTLLLQIPPEPGAMGAAAQANTRYTVLCHFALPFDFPQQPPQMSLVDFPSNGDPRPLDRQHYRYSPRWDAKRMARELVAHAIGEVSHVLVDAS